MQRLPRVVIKSHSLGESRCLASKDRSGKIGSNAVMIVDTLLISLLSLSRDRLSALYWNSIKSICFLPGLLVNPKPKPSTLVSGHACAGQRAGGTFRHAVTGKGMGRIRAPLPEPLGGGMPEIA